VNQHLPTAEIFAVQLQCEKPQCLGTVTVRCPFCATLHVHRVFANDTIVFTRTAPCSTDTEVRQYNVDLNLTVPKRDVSQPHLVSSPASKQAGTIETIRRLMRLR
jgi:hypothetical protein